MEPPAERRVMAKTTESPSVMQKSRVNGNQPKQEDIALRAYYIYLQRGDTPGNETADWLQAERELLEENGSVRRKAAVKSIAA
jgi:hypothetical protein